MGIEGKLLVSRKNIVVNKESIGIDNDLTKDRNMNTFKTYCKRRKSGARFPDRKAKLIVCVRVIALLAMLKYMHHLFKKSIYLFKKKKKKKKQLMCARKSLNIGGYS